MPTACASGCHGGVAFPARSGRRSLVSADGPQDARFTRTEAGVCVSISGARASSQARAFEDSFGRAQVSERERVSQPGNGLVAVRRKRGSLLSHARAEQHGDQHRGVRVVVPTSVNAGEVRHRAAPEECQIVAAECAARRMRREAIKRDRPWSVAANSQLATASRHVPPAAIEELSLGASASPCSHDPVGMTGVLAVVERDEVQVARRLRRRRSIRAIQARVGDDAT
jgi:hypothetical protein